MIAAKTAAEAMLVAPPKNAEAAPWSPHKKPSASAIDTVTIDCQRMTMRTGLFRIQGIMFDFYQKLLSVMPGC